MTVRPRLFRLVDGDPVPATAADIAAATAPYSAAELTAMAQQQAKQAVVAQLQTPQAVQTFLASPAGPADVAALQAATQADASAAQMAQTKLVGTIAQINSGTITTPSVL